MASKSHRQKVEEFNKQLDKLPTHFDIPKVFFILVFCVALLIFLCSSGWSRLTLALQDSLYQQLLRVIFCIREINGLVSSLNNIHNSGRAQIAVCRGYTSKSRKRCCPVTRISMRASYKPLRMKSGGSRVGFAWETTTCCSFLPKRYPSNSNTIFKNVHFIRRRNLR